LRSLASIVESIDRAIVSKKLDGIITGWNRGAERVNGYTAGEAIGESITLVQKTGAAKRLTFSRGFEAESASTILRLFVGAKTAA
jgi:PAS domain S-box-containing protein